MSYYAIVLSDCNGWNDGRVEEAVKHPWLDMIRLKRVSSASSVSDLTDEADDTLKRRDFATISAF